MNLAQPRAPAGLDQIIGDEVQNEHTSNPVQEFHHPLGDLIQEEAMDEIYSIDGRNSTPSDLTRMYVLIDRLLSKQDEMAKTIERLQDNLSGPTGIPEVPDTSAYTSPPKPPHDPVWNQSVPCTLPAGRRARAARHTEILAMVRERVLTLLKIPSLKKGYVLPPPPPPAVCAPTQENFSLQWDETEKSQFNKIAAGVLIQEITQDPFNDLTPAEVEQLPKMVQQHIRYLCRRYKNENRINAEEFNARRLKNCAADSRKRRLFETRMRVIDRFPVSLGKHRQLMVHLGVSGMSSDEEDKQNPQVFRIRRRRELSTRVAQLKKLVIFL
ncbi:hypothetical protein FRC08_009536 [Ceratobasidium sp. 394]|nr:hypothetical protein FRC08_009536 [Ceratobasidium sp. 394]